MAVPVTMASATSVTAIVVSAVVPVMVTTIPVAAIIAVAITVVTHEVHRLTAGAVLAAIARPVPGVAGWHAHVDRALVHRNRGLLDDDGLWIDQGGLLIADIDTTVKAWLGHTDAHTDIGGARPGTLAGDGCQTDEAQGAAEGGVRR